ncbi:hypothetical protein [Horticoccus sp. 23ND18S-11]|uniref:hypothetical protein n=1 Tax=Horticoccus sp. 23ND18S-11 TaxID=3391832 RepID=UPI0039C9AA24
MTTFRGDCIVFEPAQLLPESWRTFLDQGPVRTFNPGLLRAPDGRGWVLAYRVVGADGARRIAWCQLDDSLQIVAGSPTALTDLVRFRPDGGYPEVATRWFADPRLYQLNGRVFIYWNSGWHEPRNYQFLQELDSSTLQPIGHPREMLLRGDRQKLEKNWTLFPGENGTCQAVYSVVPHRVLQASLDGENDILFEECVTTAWSIAGYPACHGGLRGGAPSYEFAGARWSFCHSVHDGADGYRYAPAVYAFAPQDPFAPTKRPVRPLALGNPFGGQRTHARLNPAVGEVIYPCGAAHDGARWMVSHGLNDEYCALSLLPHADVLATVQPVSSSG